MKRSKRWIFVVARNWVWYVCQDYHEIVSWASLSAGKVTFGQPESSMGGTGWIRESWNDKNAWNLCLIWWCFRFWGHHTSCYTFSTFSGETRDKVLAAMKVDHSKSSPFLHLPPTELTFCVFPSRIRGIQSLIIISWLSSHAMAQRSLLDASDVSLLENPRACRALCPGIYFSKWVLSVKRILLILPGHSLPISYLLSLLSPYTNY